MAFAAGLAMHVAPRLFRTAKKLRNQGLPAALTALCAGAVAYDIALAVGGAAKTRMLLGAIVLVLATLMLFMGGRIIAPAAAGQLYRQGIRWRRVSSQGSKACYSRSWPPRLCSQCCLDTTLFYESLARPRAHWRLCDCCDGDCGRAKDART
jgi:hypothetical protein